MTERRYTALRAGLALRGRIVPAGYIAMARLEMSRLENEIFFILGKFYRVTPGSMYATARGTGLPEQGYSRARIAGQQNKGVPLSVPRVPVEPSHAVQPGAMKPSHLRHQLGDACPNVVPRHDSRRFLVNRLCLGSLRL